MSLAVSLKDAVGGYEKIIERLKKDAEILEETDVSYRTKELVAGEIATATEKKEGLERILEKELAEQKER